jgi:methionyl-tRNA synthetase
MSEVKCYFQDQDVEGFDGTECKELDSDGDYCHGCGKHVCGNHSVNFSLMRGHSPEDHAVMEDESDWD